MGGRWIFVEGSTIISLGAGDNDCVTTDDRKRLVKKKVGGFLEKTKREKQTRITDYNFSYPLYPIIRPLIGIITYN